MRRKIIKQGASTLTISLPSAWTKRFGMKAGDEISIEEAENTLVLSGEQKIKKAETVIDFSKVDPGMLKSYLYYAYVNGYDSVRLLHLCKAEHKEIADFVSNLIGFEIVDECHGSVRIRDFSGEAEEDFDQILRRIFLLITAFAEDGLVLLDEKRIAEARVFSTRDHTVNKFVAYCLRVLNKRGHSDFRKTTVYYTILYMLEELSDEYARIFYHLKGPLRKETLKMYSESIDIYRALYKVFYRFDSRTANDIISWRNRLRDKITARMSNRHAEDNKVLYRLTKIAEFVVDIIRVRVSLEL